MAFESFLTYVSSRLRSGWGGQAYSEQAFRHFLALERKRAERSARSFLLVLVSLRKRPEAGDRLPRAVAGAVFSSLARSVREVDFIGWYREGRVAGAVLAQGADPPAEVSRRVAERIGHVVAGRLSSAIDRQLRVRVVRFPRITRG